jgi:putative membrane protein (TIGR04086 family)
MAVKRKMSGNGVSIPAGIAIGVDASIAVMLIGALVMAYLVIRETVPMDGIGFGTACILIISSALGAWIATVLSKQKKLLVCGLTALMFYLVLLSVAAVFFDGMFSGMGITALMILLGAGGALLPGMRKKSGKSKIKIPAYR